MRQARVFSSVLLLLLSILFASTFIIQVDGRKDVCGTGKDYRQEYVLLP